MLRLVAGAMPILVVLVGPTSVWAIEDIKKDTIGPWEIEATFKNDKFDHCAISRSVDDVVARFVRTNDGLSLSLQSPNWKLERGKNYPVHMKAGATSWDTEVSAETNSVSVPIADKRFSSGLRAANALLVQGAGATIQCRDPVVPECVPSITVGRECGAHNTCVRRRVHQRERPGVRLKKQ